MAPTRQSALPLIGPDEIRQRIGRDVALRSARRAFKALAEGVVVLPPPMSLHFEDRSGEVHVKGAWIQSAPVFAIKVASGFYRNPDRGLPSGSGLILVLDAQTGFPLGVLSDEGYLTELRTGAAGALAVDQLTGGPLGTVALIGAGVQARFQLAAIADVRDIGEVRAWAPHTEQSRSFAREMSDQYGLSVQAVPTVELAVRGADLIVTVTPSREPLVESQWVGSSATVVAVGADAPYKQELEPELLARADKVVVDSLEQCATLGELHHALEAGVMDRRDVYGTLGEIVAGRLAGRHGDELIVCDLTGVGVQDAANAEAVWEVLRPGTPRT